MLRTVRTESFFVTGKPVGKPRARSVGFRRGDGSIGTRQYSDKKGVMAEDRIYNAYVEHFAGSTMPPVHQGPVQLQVVAFFEVPVSWPKWKREAALAGELPHLTKPDADNVLKAVCDALNGLAWSDDCAVYDKHPVKWYSDTPGMQVRIDFQEFERR